MVVAASVSAEFPPPPQHFAGIQTHSARALLGNEVAPKAAALSPVIRLVALSPDLWMTPHWCIACLALSRHPDRSKARNVGTFYPALVRHGLWVLLWKRSSSIRDDAVMEAEVAKGDGWTRSACSSSLKHNMHANRRVEQNTHQAQTHTSWKGGVFSWDRTFHKFEGNIGDVESKLRSRLVFRTRYLHTFVLDIRRC